MGPRMSRIEPESETWKPWQDKGVPGLFQGRQTGPGQVRAIPGQLCSALARNGQNRISRAGTDQSQVREGPDQDCSRQAGVKGKADLGQTKRMARKRHGRASKAMTGKAKPGRSMTG